LREGARLKNEKGSVLKLCGIFISKGGWVFLLLLSGLSSPAHAARPSKVLNRGDRARQPAQAEVARIPEPQIPSAEELRALNQQWGGEIARATRSCPNPVREYDFGGHLGRWRNINCRHWQKVASHSPGGGAASLNSGTSANSGGSLPAGGGERTAGCGPRMKTVTGNYLDRPSSEVEEVQAHSCGAWQTEEPTRCAVYDRSELRRDLDALLARARNAGNLTPMRTCMDTYEFPNQAGDYPWVAAHWYDANQICELQGKRLCSEKEWVFACESEEARPYPYESYEMRKNAAQGGCNAGVYGDVSGPRAADYVSARGARSESNDEVLATSAVNPFEEPGCQEYVRMVRAIEERQQARENERARSEGREPRNLRAPDLRTQLGRFAQSDPRHGRLIACLWGGLRSGEAHGCVSKAEVHDLTGNVDEWVNTSKASREIATLRPGWTDRSASRILTDLQNRFPSSERPYPSPLKGGWWGPVRNRCRPATTAHGPSFTYYQVGFRCCKDAPAVSNP
jgi:formylglycine-generating enzyme required for sulfatase activity